jgi:2-octaprenyl-6-methoxyphenol hydroxylase
VRDEELEQVIALDDEHFVAQFQTRFGYRLGRFIKVGRRNSYPLTFLRARASVVPRVAIIGNAAHTLHPVAGQGFNLGLRDVAALAEVVMDTHRAGGDIGSLETLAGYDRWRGREQKAVALATDGLVRIFSNPLGPLRVARNLGMLALDALPFSKHLLAKSAMGTIGALPKLARGLSLD